MDRPQLISILAKLRDLIAQGSAFLSNYSEEKDKEFDEWTGRCKRVLAQSDQYNGAQDATRFGRIAFSSMVISASDESLEDYEVWLYPGITEGLEILSTVLKEIEVDLGVKEDAGKVSSVPDKAVFVIHGRNEKRKNALFDWLRSLHLHPMEWEEVVALTGNASASTLDVVKAGLEAAAAVVALFTDDEEVVLRPELRSAEHEGGPGFQARPNVIFEAGMACAAGGEKRTIFLEWGNVRRFSDIDGVNNIRFGECPDAVMLQRLRRRLETAGCKPKDTGEDWLKIGRFQDAVALPSPKF